MPTPLAGTNIRISGAEDTRYLITNRTAPSYFKGGEKFIYAHDDRQVGVTRHQRRHGWACIYMMSYYQTWTYTPHSLIHLPTLRRALDTLTIEDETAIIHIPLNFRKNEDGMRIINYYNRKYIEVTLRKDGRVQMLMPCSDKRKFKVETLDRILTRMGY